EHGRSPDAKVARWQDRLTPIQRRIGGGCHLNRPIDALLSDAGLDVTSIEHYYMRGPKPLGYMYEGVAIKRRPAGLLSGPAIGEPDETVLERPGLRQVELRRVDPHEGVLAASEQ